ncbi:unnamed protein product [Chondrus crispus]|uniref:Aminoglycoside phosphotransferase domain-containing protein n=1 Tax=Chondrus crispus TaxID=2769 RepID=R7QQM7_CHOCR|nr:unnamed protein product [Chondrus crispus]CDF39690.1 unnamed protein product [Chondrus crispus]|eukprot:XP_005709984.1 unnamed protein product [Chondrus crispus]
MTLAELPYFADDALLPESLPTCSAIRSSADVLVDQSTHRVVGVGIHFIVKYGKRLDLMEGQNMLYVQQATSVSVPRVYAMFHESESSENFIVMERIKGKRLDREWSLLGQREKRLIASKLKRDFEELRKLPSPGGFCSLGNRPLLDDIFWTDSESTSLTGPFATESAFNEALIALYLHNKPSKYKADFYRRTLPSVVHESCALFTHGDFQGKNVLLRRLTEKGSDAVDVSLIDWEFSGWYPSYWEFSKSLLACGRWENDWSTFLDTILPNRWSQTAWLDMFLGELLI